MNLKTEKRILALLNELPVKIDYRDHLSNDKTTLKKEYFPKEVNKINPYFFIVTYENNIIGTITLHKEGKLKIYISSEAMGIILDSTMPCAVDSLKLQLERAHKHYMKSPLGTLKIGFALTLSEWKTLSGLKERVDKT